MAGVPFGVGAQLGDTGHLSVVLHHDLNQDMRRACHVIMQAHRALPGPVSSWPSNIQVITAYNIPIISHS